MTESLVKMPDLYAGNVRSLPDDVSPRLGSVWRDAISGYDRERAFRALEVATLFALRRSVRNGSVWIEHSLTFRGRDRLFLPAERWQAEAKRHYARLSLPAEPADFLTPLLARVRAGVDAVAQATRSGVLHVDDELHLAALPADDEDPAVTKLRARLDHRIGEVQLPEVILAVDARVHFSWIMLGREPRSADELLMAYAGILAHGTSLTAADCARMMPQLSAASIRQAMRWAGDERRLALACQAVLEFMQGHAIAATWGRSDLASSDMMSMETTKRVWQARLDPRRSTPSIGIYSHVRDRWGIFNAQPFVLNKRQAGVAIEGVVRMVAGLRYRQLSHRKRVDPILGGIGAHPDDVLHMKRTADRLFSNDYRWSVLGAGRNQMKVAAMAASMGGMCASGWKTACGSRRRRRHARFSRSRALRTSGSEPARTTRLTCS